MKNTFTLLLFLFVSVPIFTQAQFSVGTGLVIGNEDEGRYGLNIRTAFPIADRLYLVPNLSLFAPENERKRYTGSQGTNKERYRILAVDAQYRFEISPQLRLYPLAGIQMAFRQNELSFNGQTNTDNNREASLNLGGGGMYELLDQLSAFLEVNYSVGGLEQLAATVGINYQLFD